VIAKYSYLPPSLRIRVLGIPMFVQRVRILEERNGKQKSSVAILEP